jgi:hypothetical protein
VEEEDSLLKNHPRLGFPFSSFPCESGRAETFARHLHSKRDFRSNLLLIGPNGADFDAICRDLARFLNPPEPLLHLSAATFDARAEASLAERLENIPSLLLQVSEIENARPEVCEKILSLAKAEAPFDKGAPNRRLVFCLHKDVDTLYDEGALDENLYIFLGTQEISIPALQEMPEEVPALFYRYWRENLSDSADRKSQPELTDEAEQFLRSFGWPGDAAQLRQTVQQLQEIAGLEIIGVSHLESAVKGELKGEETATGEHLREGLTQLRNEWLAAARLLAHGDLRLASTAVGLPESFLNAPPATARP